MLGDGGSGVSISFSLSGHAVSLLLVELGNALGLVSESLVWDTFVATVDGSTAGRSAHGAETLLGSTATIDIHGIGVLGTHARPGAATATRLLASTLGNLGGVDTELVEGIVELGERLLHLLAGDDGLVLEALLHAGLVADELLLLADQLGLAHDLGILVVLKILIRLVEAFGLELLLLFLESLELGLDVGIDKVVDVLSIVNLGNLVVLPLGVLKHVVGLHVDVEHTSTTILVLLITSGSSSLRIDGAS